jgi:hypothetical protein
MHGLSDPLSVVSKNVRVALPRRGSKPSINDDLKKTYETEPNQFWYSHNGITIICDKITRVDNEIKLQNPNVVNGAQTILTLETSQKVNPKATMLARIFEQRSHDMKTKKLIFNMIVRTNKQNPILWRDLRSNEESLKNIDEYFVSKRVYFERRRGEKNIMQARFSRLGSTVSTDPVELGQIVRICQNDYQGPVLAKGSKEQMFEDETLFKNLFKIPGLDEQFLQMTIRKLVINELFKNKKFKSIKGTNWIVASVFGIFWLAIKRLSTGKYRKINETANRELSLFSCKAKRTGKLEFSPELTPLLDVIDHILKLAVPIARKYLYSGKLTLRAFIDIHDANKDLFEACKSDIGKSLRGSSKRRLKNGSGLSPLEITSKGVIQDIQNTLYDYIKDWEDCQNISCGKLTNTTKLESDGCQHCHFGYCPHCDQLTDFEEEKCVHCDQELWEE